MDMKDYLVSVIIPVYNAEKYIADTIKSVCNQTYKVFEVVLIDDESADNSISIAEEILKVNHIKTFTIRQKNKGLPGARNIGINNAKGDYVCFIDSDDIIAPNHLFDLVSVINDRNVDVAFSMFEYTKEIDRFGKRNELYQPKMFDKEEFLYNFVRRKPAVHCCSLMIKLSFLRDEKLMFNEKLKKYGEDVEFMWRLFPKIDRIACTGNYTYKYLVRNNSLMTVGNTEPWNVFLKEFTNTIKAECNAYPNLSRYYHWAYYRTIVGLLRIIAESTEYAVFKLYADKLITDKLLQSMKMFPDVKIRAMIKLLKYQKKIYYFMFRKRVRFYNEVKILNRS